MSSLEQMFRMQVNGIKGCRLRMSGQNSIMYVTYSQLAQVVNFDCISMTQVVT